MNQRKSEVCVCVPPGGSLAKNRKNQGQNSFTNKMKWLFVLFIFRHFTRCVIVLNSRTNYYTIEKRMSQLKQCQTYFINHFSFKPPKKCPTNFELITSIYLCVVVNKPLNSHHSFKLRFNRRTAYEIAAPRLCQSPAINPH